MFRKFPHWFDNPPSSSTPGKVPKNRSCSQPECLDEGVYRAPKSRYHLKSGNDDWHWFCLIHARDYNARWNYYANMPESEWEEERQADVTGQRPSWPFGVHTTTAQSASKKPFGDPFGLFNDPDPSGHASYPPPYPPHSSEAKALHILGLSYPFSAADLRKRYRTLVKEHHPDTNGGDAEAEETLKRINEAYGVLKKLFT